MKKLLVFALLSIAFAVSACDSGTDNNSNATSNTKSAPTVEQAPATPAPTVEASPSAKPSIKVGDKVKVTINGTSSAATVVSIDEKAGKVTVKIEGQSGEKIVAISDVTKQ